MGTPLRLRPRARPAGHARTGEALRGALRPRPGGIASLYELLAEHGGAVEADLLRFYNVDLGDLVTGRLSWRRLWVLLQHLPADAATIRDRIGPSAAWTTTEHLLALIADHLAHANWQRQGKRTAKRPQPLPRPGQNNGHHRIGARSRPRSMREVDRLMAHWSAPRPDRVEGARTIH